jgi:hypothetical protein
VDEAKWEHQIGGTGWGNAELEYYTDRIENSYIENPDGENGVLVIKAIKEKYERLGYTSARITTRGKFEQMFGRFEVRANSLTGKASGLRFGCWAMLGPGRMAAKLILWKILVRNQILCMAQFMGLAIRRQKISGSLLVCQRANALRMIFISMLSNGNRISFVFM